MNDTNLSSETANYILAQAPVLLASLGGLIVALRLRRKAPAASLWTAGAFALVIFTRALVGIGQAAGSRTATYFIGPVLSAIAYVLLLIGVYAGRTSPSAAPTASSESLWQNVMSTVRARPGLFAISRMLFVGVFLLVVITATLVTFTLPESFASISRIMLRLNSSNAAGPTAPQDASGTFDPRFIRNQCAVIQSEGILGKVISDLDLNKEWGKRYAGGERLKTSETLALLRARMDWRLLPKTSVIEIRSYSEKPDEAAKVANALAEAYRDHINSPESAVSVSSGARVKMLAMPATTPEPVPPDSATSRSSGLRVEILDRAVPGLVPVRPNKPLNISLGVLIGLLLGFLAGAGAWWVGLQAGQKPGANPQS